MAKGKTLPPPTGLPIGRPALRPAHCPPSPRAHRAGRGLLQPHHAFAGQADGRAAGDSAVGVEPCSQKRLTLRDTSSLKTNDTFWSQRLCSRFMEKLKNYQHHHQGLFFFKTLVKLLFLRTLTTTTILLQLCVFFNTQRSSVGICHLSLFCNDCNYVSSRPTTVGRSGSTQW